MRLALTLALAVCSGCGADGDGVGDADPFAPDADPFAPDADPLAPDADPLAPDGGAGGADAAIPAFPSCYGGCVTAADCGYGLAVNDADNYECRGGACVYTGCNSTAECVATYMSDDYGCGTVPGYPAPMCLHTCVTPGDCATASAAYDADNYRCTGGLCEYIGCRSDPECATLGNYGCHAFAGWIYPFCTQRCATAADCAVPTGGTLYDVDNYACEGGYCRWIGCHDAGECRDSLMDPDAVCRDVSGTGSP